MKQTVNFCDFTDAFRDYNRQDSYSYKGKKALFEMFEELDESCGTETELDVITICCEFSEYASALDCIEEAGYDCEILDENDLEESEDYALNWLRDNTMVHEFDGGIIIQDF